MAVDPAARVGVRRLIGPWVAPAGAAELGVAALETSGPVRIGGLLQDRSALVPEFSASVEDPRDVGEGPLTHPAIVVRRG